MRKHLGAALISVAVLAACNEQEASQSAAKTSEAQTPTAPIESTAPTMSESEKANALFETFFEETVALSPETLTFLGRKERADEWNDLSDKASEEALELSKKQLAELNTIDRAKLDEPTALSLSLIHI